ncbi:MAG: hypothetical protein AAF292_06460 [Pseudomonadota bacterium]
MRRILIYSTTIILIALNVTDTASAQFEACVGAKGAQKAGFCKYEYEAYLTRGSCVARGGGWVEGTSVTLNVRAPGHLQHSRSGTRYINFDDRTGPEICQRACAGTTITYQGRTYTKSTCDAKSYEPSK